MEKLLEASFFFFLFFLYHGIDSLFLEVGKNLSILDLSWLDLLNRWSIIPRMMNNSVDNMLVTILTVNQYSVLYLFSLTTLRHARFKNLLHNESECRRFTSLRNLNPSLLTDH